MVWVTIVKHSLARICNQLDDPILRSNERLEPETSSVLDGVRRLCNLDSSISLRRHLEQSSYSAMLER